MKIAIVGGGAAGLMAACRLVDRGYKPVLFERGERVGRKLAITGKGRCNLTNASDVQTVLSNIPGNGRFLYGAMDCFPPSAVRSYFEDELSLPLKVERGNRVFPQSDKARDVVEALRSHAEKGGCTFVFEKVVSLALENGKVTGLATPRGTVRFDKVLLATGGCSYPTTGSDGQGYKLAEQAGHSIVKPVPSLVPLVCYGSMCKALMGLSLKNTAISVVDTHSGKKIYEDFGEMLFTHFGLSGPMILSASAHLRDMSEGRYEIHIDLKPALDEQTLDKRLQSDFLKYKNKDFANALSDLLPSKLIPVVVSLSGIDPHGKVNEVRREERQKLLSILKDLKVTVKGFRPIDEAIVTSGGVCVKEVNPKTMESKLTRGLYFAGELLDVDAYTGGFNLQIAFSTAALSVKAMTEDENE